MVNENFVLRKAPTKETSLAVSLILLLSISAFAAVLPSAQAHSPAWTIPTWTYLSVSPTPIGVNQPLFVIIWLNLPPPTAYGVYGDRWEGIKITVSKPDGTSQTLGPFKSDPVGTAYTIYNPDQAGKYYFQANFPGQTLAGVNPPLYPASSVWVGDIYQPSTSRKMEITVASAPLQTWQETPLPTGYWARPINGLNRVWASIAGNWLGGAAGNVNYISPAPDSAHIVWAKPIALGGISGQFNDVSYYDGLSYEPKFTTPVIIQGVLYYNDYPTIRYAATDKYPTGFTAVDLRTGEKLWWKNDTITFGEILDWESPNQHGTSAYLWKTDGTTWHMFDAFNGNDLVTILGVPSGTSAIGSDGSPLIYQYNAQRGWLSLWNSSKAVQYPCVQAGSNYYFNWRPQPGQIINASWGYQWNKTLSSTIPTDSYVTGIDSDILLLTSGLATGPGGVGTGLTPATYKQAAINLKAGQEGQLLWLKEYSAPPGNVTITSGSVGEGVFTLRSKETMQWYGYDLTTGNLLWGPTGSQSDWDVYGMGGTIAYGKLLSCGYGGVLYAYDIKTGKQLWNYTAQGIGFESYYGNYPLSIGAVADKKVFLYSSEHSPSKPLWRGSMVRCIDVNTGIELWKVSTWGNNAIIADGYLVSINGYDNRLYCYGKGQTSTTVSAPQLSIPRGSGVLITGTVTDQSSGAKGTPAIADSSMTTWMEYLYMQQTKPTTATGVPVHLTATDPNGNYQDIGTATSDALGNFVISWTPPITGLYKVKATFEGSNSYFSSEAGTAFYVAETATSPQVEPTATLPPPTVAPTQPTQQTPSPSPSQAVEPPTSGISTTTYAAIGVAVLIIVVAAAALVLRRRK
jgi:hypothetical protein